MRRCRFLAIIKSEGLLKTFEGYDAPDQVYGQNFHITVDIISLTISPATEPFRLASIRFRKKVVDIQNNKTKEQFYTARVVFGFDPTKMFLRRFD